MESKNKLIKDSEQALSSLQEIIEQVNYIRNKISTGQENYNQSKSYENRLELESALLLYNRYLRYGSFDLLDYNRGVFQQSAYGATFNISVDGEWSAFEFEDTFGAINQLYELSFVGERIKNNQLDIPRTNSFARSDYENGNLFQFLDYDDELRVKRVSYNSPGDIEFFSLVAEHSPEIIKTVLISFGLIKLIPDLCMRIPAIYRNWIQEIATSREIRRRDRQLELLQSFFEIQISRLINEELDGEQREKVNQSLDEIFKVIMVIVERNATDGINMTKDSFVSLSHLAKMYKKKKINLPDSDN